MSTISLVIPCYNEALNIPSLLERCATVFTNESVELILVDNGSTDATQAILAEHLPQYSFARSIRVEKNKGYGYGILTGLAIANSEYIGWTHADLQADPADVLMALEILHTNRVPLFLKGKRYGRKATDLFFTIGMSIFESILLKVGFWDINAQPNIMPKFFFEGLKNPPHDFSFDLYAYYMAKKLKLKIKRFPVFFGRRIAGEAHLNNLKAKLKYVTRTIKYTLSLRSTMLQE